MKVRFFAVTFKFKEINVSARTTFMSLLFVPNGRHWNTNDFRDCFSVVWEKELDYDNALQYCDMSKDDFDRHILETTIADKSRSIDL